MSGGNVPDLRITNASVKIAPFIAGGVTMNDEMAKTLAILMEEMINQMYLLRLEMERERLAVSRALDSEFVAEEFARIGAALINRGELELVEGIA